MTKKDRTLLKRIGMLEEFDIWKLNIPKVQFKIGTKVRFKKEGMRPLTPVGTLGKIVETNATFIDGIIQVRTIENQNIGFWDYELKEYLEKV